jgi:hypothetical protein
MILWVKRLTALLNGAFLFVLLLSRGHTEAATVGVIINLAWALSERSPSSIGRLFHSPVFVANTTLSAYGLLSGGHPVLAVVVASGSLLSWNTGLFLKRWPDAPLAVQYRYLRRIGAVVALGMGAGLSAWSLQGYVGIPFYLALLLMLNAGILWLRLVSKALKGER